ncbi:MAG: GNAT family N-acetyltransferase [Candidatus Lokiarchaeia archaeon]
MSSSYPGRLDFCKSQHKTKNGLNLTVREISKKDLENLNEILNQEEVNKFLLINGSSLDETLRYYKNYLNERKIGKKYQFVAEINERAVGTVSLEQAEIKGVIQENLPSLLIQNTKD